MLPRLTDNTKESLEEWVVAVLVKGFLRDMDIHAVDTASSEWFDEIRALVRIIQIDENILYGCTGECTEDNFLDAPRDVHGLELPAVAE